MAFDENLKFWPSYFDVNEEVDPIPDKFKFCKMNQVKMSQATPVSKRSQQPKNVGDHKNFYADAVRRLGFSSSESSVDSIQDKEQQRINDLFQKGLPEAWSLKCNDNELDEILQ